MYQQYKDQISGAVITSAITRLSDMSCIPFSLDNTDYQRFKQDIADGAELQDADGVVMSPEQVAEFMETLP